MVPRFGAQPFHNAGFFMRLVRRPLTYRQPRTGLGKQYRCGWTNAMWLMFAVVAPGCQDAGPPGVMERTGAEVDRTMGHAQQGAGDFSLRVGRALNQAGQSVGDAANVAGTSVHDWLIPIDKADQAPEIGPASGKRDE